MSFRIYRHLLFFVDYDWYDWSLFGISGAFVGLLKKKKKEKVRQDSTEAGEQLVVLSDCFSWHDGLAQQHKREGEAKNSRNTS